MIAAILGASGLIGSRIVEMFHLNGLAEARPVVRSYAGLARLARFNLDSRLADAFDQKALESAFDGCDIVIHTVAGDPKTILGTLEPTYQAAQQTGVQRLVYISTASVHGQAPAPGTDEHSPLSDRQQLPYNNAKVTAERKLERLRERGEVELVRLRPGIVHGPRSPWITGFADDLLAGRAYLLNGGQGICNGIYVDNLVHAIYLAGTTPQVDREVFLIGDQEQVTWADLYRPVAEALGYDLAQVPEAEVPGFNLTRLDRLEKIRNSGPVQAFLSIFPLRLRLAAYTAYCTLAEPPPESPWKMPALEKPVASLERSLLYQCQYKFPNAKAQKLLGDEPVVAFPEACRRTIAWLAFAGYPVAGEQAGVQPGELLQDKMLR